MVHVFDLNGSLTNFASGLTNASNTYNCKISRSLSRYELKITLAKLRDKITLDTEDNSSISSNTEFKIKVIKT